MKLVFMYAGQGSQKAGMGKDLYEEFAQYREIADSEKISSKYLELMHEGTLEELSKTENTQPCMSIFAAGVTNVLKKHGITPDAACGLSLGEYGALYAAGVMDADTYINLTAFRGQKMMEAAKGHVCSMSAIMGMEAAVVEEACEACKDYGFVTLANYNCAGQYVICGDEKAVAATEEYLKEKGARRCVRLNVSGPFHTKYMKPAGDALREKFKELDLKRPNIPVVMNVTGDFLKEDEEVATLLEKQVQNSVHFEESITRLLNEGADVFVEIGPGSTLSGFLKKTAKALEKEITVYNIETAESLHKIIDEGVLING
ncbi:MAG: ACP S-malonyltransferase [Lachnospiraceae bacterium]